jgi:polysaccharide pyruvyl transferase WcaK-like protein
LKIHIIAQGAGPIRSFSGGIMASLIVAVADTVSLRDIESGKLISGITGRGNEIKIVADTALSAVPRLGKNTPGAGKVLGVNLRRWYHLKQNSLIPYEYRKRFFSKEDEGSEIMNGFIAGFACFLDGLIEKYNFDIRIIPMYGGSIETWEDDLVLGTEMKNRMKYSGRVHVARGCFEIKGFLELFRDLDFMIGMRLHSTILATALKVPSIHLAYSPKGYSYFKRLKMPELVLPLDKLAIEKDCQSLADCFELLFSDRERFRKWLRSEIPGLEVEAGKCIEQILLK